VTNITPHQIEIVAKGSGIDLLGHHLSLRQDTLNFPFVSDFLDNHFAQTRAYQKVAQDQIPSTLSVVSFWPDRIDLGYLLRTRKNVPLRLATSIQLKPAYQMNQPASLNVDSVMIIGPQHQLDTIQEWFTEAGKTPILSADTALEIRVADSMGIEVSPKVVSLNVRPRLYTETNIPVKVQVQDKPGNVDVRFVEKTIDVTCLVPFDAYESFQERSNEFLASVPFDRLDPNFGKIIPTVSVPEGAKLISHHPQQVQFVIVRP
ncbi:MAG: hypothetical protein AAF399_02105, partial [Bacteroidota bacterium]